MNGLTAIPYCPHAPSRRQRLFLALNTREALYGGAAMGGKSDALLMAALQYVDRPNYSAIIFRRTHEDLALPGALLDRADLWLRPYADDKVPADKRVRWDGQHKQWRFPSGAVLAFGYMDNDEARFRYKSAEFQFAGFDELTTFTEVQYGYLGSRLRRLKGMDVPIRLRGATNPGDRGHAWVKKRFIDNRSSERPFVTAKVRDNPAADADEYIATMEATLDQTTLMQLRDGLWIIDDAARMYHYNSTQMDVPALPVIESDTSASLWQRVFVIDLGASTKDPTTSQTRLAYHPHLPHEVFVEYSFKQTGMDPDDIAEAGEREMAECGGELTIVLDEGALGHGYGNKMREKHGLPVIAAEKSEKRANVRMLNGAIQRNRVHCVAGRCDDLIAETETVIYDKKGLDAEPGIANHCTDGLLYGWRWTYAHRGEKQETKPAERTPDWWVRREREQHEREKEQVRARRGPEGFARW